MRVLASALAVVAFAAATAADACSCIRYATQAEADEAGERVYGSADLIVEATVGQPSGAVRAICYAEGDKPDPAWVGKRLSADRPLEIHRVIKGRAPSRAMLSEHDLDVSPGWCAASVSSCDSNVASGTRLILILRQVGDGRYQAESQCAYFTLRHSARGRLIYGPSAPIPS